MGIKRYCRVTVSHLTLRIEMMVLNDNSHAQGGCPTDNGPLDDAWFGAIMVERLIDRLARF